MKVVQGGEQLKDKQNYRALEGQHQDQMGCQVGILYKVVK